MRQKVIAMLLPVRILWPWALASAGFVAFLGSSQGASLTSNFALEPTRGALVVATLLFAYVLTAFGGWFAALAATAFPPLVRLREQAPAPLQAWTIGWIAAWIAVLAIVPTWVFALATQSFAAWTMAIAFALLSVSLAYWGARSATVRSDSWGRILNVSRRHRFVLVVVMLAFACVPLAIGAAVATHSPATLSAVGPILVTLTGLVTLATLVGALFVVLPCCLYRPWLGWVVLALVVAHAWIAPRSIDDENPLLHKERVAATVSEGDWKSSCAGHRSSVFEEIRHRALHAQDSTNSVTEADARLQALSRLLPPQFKPDLGVGFPTLYLVSAEGGGIRAAYWTAMGLGQLDIATHDQFASQVVSLSGVSGGSLGIATWLAAHEVPRLSPDQRLELMGQFLGSDFLSPLIGGLFFLDAPRLFFGDVWPSGRRDHVFQRYLYDRWFALSEGGDFFARPLRRLCLKEFDRAPQVFFNTTDALSGRSVPLGNSTYDARAMFSDVLDNPIDFTSLRWITVAQGVSISAGFPFLAPGTDVGVNARQVVLADAQGKADDTPRGRRGRSTSETGDTTGIDQADLANADAGGARVAVLVDGGYFDNSGLTPTIDALDAMSTPRAVGQQILGRQPVQVLHFSNDPGNACVPLDDGGRQSISPAARDFLAHASHKLNCGYEISFIEGSMSARAFQFLTTPLETIFSVRGAHAAMQLDYLTRRFFPDSDTQARATRGALPFPTLVDSRRKLNKLAVASELAGMFDKTLVVQDQFGNPWTLERDRIQKISNWERDHVPEAAAAEGIAPEAVHARLDQWRSAALDAERRWHCASDLKVAQPPLGWMLSRDDRALLQCLSARAAIRAGFPDLTPPGPIGVDGAAQ